MGPSIGGLIDLSHATLTNEGSHVIVAESGADFESHELSWVYRRSFTGILFASG